MLPRCNLQWPTASVSQKSGLISLMWSDKTPRTPATLQTHHIKTFVDWNQSEGKEHILPHQCSFLFFTSFSRLFKLGKLWATKPDSSGVGVIEVRWFHSLTCCSPGNIRQSCITPHPSMASALQIPAQPLSFSSDIWMMGTDKSSTLDILTWPTWVMVSLKCPNKLHMVLDLVFLLPLLAPGLWLQSLVLNFPFLFAAQITWDYWCLAVKINPLCCSQLEMSISCFFSQI